MWWFFILPKFPANTETRMSFWRNFGQWLHRKLSFWSFSVGLQPVIKISLKRHFWFSDSSVTLATNSMHIIYIYIHIYNLCGGDMRTCLHTLATISELLHRVETSFEPVIPNSQRHFRHLYYGGQHAKHWFLIHPSKTDWHQLNCIPHRWQLQGDSGQEWISTGLLTPGTKYHFCMEETWRTVHWQQGKYQWWANYCVRNHTPPHEASFLHNWHLPCCMSPPYKIVFTYMYIPQLFLDIH